MSKFRVRFLLGGTGNQLFQIATASPETRFSKIFLAGWVPKLLRWSQHEQLLNARAPSLIATAFSMIALLADLLVFKATGRTLITDLDLQGGTSRALITPLLSLGYFQHEPIPDLPSFIYRDLIQAVRLEVVCHIRGGDFRRLENRKLFGLLDPDYYNAAVNCIGARDLEVCLVSDDCDYATSVMKSLGDLRRIKYEELPLKAMIARALNCAVYVAANSTLSYWLVKIRTQEGRPSIVPSPFQRNGSLTLRGHAVREIAVTYVP